MNFINKTIPENLKRSIDNWCPEIEKMTMPIVCGGFIRSYYAGEHPADLDLYFINNMDADHAINVLSNNKWNLVSKTAFADTYVRNNKSVQIIGFLYGIPTEVISKFDFTICMCAVDYVNSTLIIHEDFFEHLAGRILIYTGSPMPLSSMKRTYKYYRRGYSICDENIIRIAEDISKTINFDNNKEVNVHIEGMDPDRNRRMRVVD